MKMLNDMIINKKGFAFILVMIIAVVAVSIIISITSTAINELRMVERTTDSVRAFYAK